MDFSNMNSVELRKAVREKLAADNIKGKGAEMLRWSKEQMIGYLTTGNIPETEGSSAASAEAIGAAIQSAIETAMAAAGGGGVNEAAVKALIEKYAVKTIEMKFPDVEAPVNVGLQHEIFPKVYMMAKLHEDCMLVGPAGSGKTFICHAVARALSAELGRTIEFYGMSVGQQTTKADLIGFQNVTTGAYVETMLYMAYKHGGVFLLDEVDAGNAGVLTILNALLANGGFRFPNGEYVERHPDFYCFAAANTYGHGQNRMFVGRVQLDAATLDRFAALLMGYDEGLERALYGDTPITRRIQRIRAKAEELGEKVVVSPRATRRANKFVAAGMTVEDALEVALFKGINSEVKDRINVR